MDRGKYIARLAIERVGGIVDGQAVEYDFCQTDAGRCLSKRPKQKNDCTVRAMATAFELSYDDAYDILKKYGRICGRGFHIGDFLIDKKAEKISFQAVKGQRRMHPWKFCKEYNNGKYICRTAGHVFAVIDGVVFDTIAPSVDRCIYKAWKIRTKRGIL